MRLLINFLLLTSHLAALGQTSPAIKDASIYADSTYTYSNGKGVVIQNSFPKGGGGYTHSSGKYFSYVVFWSRIINETSTPLDLTIHFPADSFAIFPSPDSYLKIFLPPDTMTTDKESMYDYGLTGLTSFLDTGFNKPTMLHRTINPKEECLFYVGMIFYQARGSARSQFVLKDKNLFYKISIGSVPALIPCGQLVIKKSRR